MYLAAMGSAACSRAGAKNGGEAKLIRKVVSEHGGEEAEAAVMQAAVGVAGEEGGP